jgi:uncharacterized protein (TIGR00255 family)
MTGYGKASTTIGERTYEAEVRSLNSKQLNLRVQLPHRFQEKEIEVRSYMSERIPRGKVDLVVSGVSGEEEKLYELNHEVIKAHYQELERIASDLGVEHSDLLSNALQIPDAISYGSPEAAPYEIEELWSLLDKAIEAFEDFTEKEGGNLRDDLEEQRRAIGKGLERIQAYEEERREKVRERLQNRIKEELHADDVDEKRLEQELLHYLEKMDINEEKTRLRSHLQQFHQVMNEEGGGKKLQFISQELGREINTIGAKADHAPTQQEVVRMKDHLERIKEQVMNVR